jgi:hypothetical protein
MQSCAQLAKSQAEPEKKTPAKLSQAMDPIRTPISCPPGYAKSIICKHSHHYANENRVRKRKHIKIK